METETGKKTVKLRFYGRFAYAQPFDGGPGEYEPTGTVFVIAPTFDDKRFGKHHVLMTVRRDQVNVRRDQTGIPPTRRLVTDAAEILDAEVFAWDLEGCDVAIDVDRGTPSATFKSSNDDGEILDLGQLEARRGSDAAYVDVHALTASSGGKACAVIAITAGDGVARKVSTDDRGKLISQLNAFLDNPGQLVGQDGGNKPFELLDLVEFTITLPPTDDPAAPPTLKFIIRDVHGRDGIVTVMAGSVNDADLERSTDEVVVSFSHLCSSLPMPIKYDFEFSQYYNLLRNNPADQALILKPSQSAGEGGDCGYKSQLRYFRNDGALLQD